MPYALASGKPLRPGDVSAPVPPLLKEPVRYVCVDCGRRFESRLKPLDAVCPAGHIHVKKDRHGA